MNPVDHPHGGGEGRTWWSSSGIAMGLPDQGCEDPW
jgi:ribosomal protein L2